MQCIDEDIVNLNSVLNEFEEKLVKSKLDRTIVQSVLVAMWSFQSRLNSIIKNK